MDLKQRVTFPGLSWQKERVATIEETCLLKRDSHSSNKVRWNWNPDNDGLMLRGTTSWLGLPTYVYVLPSKFWSHFRTTKMGLQGLLDCFVPLPNVTPLNKSPSFVFHFSSCSFYLLIEDRYAYLTWGTGWNALQYWWCHGNLILKYAHFRKKYSSTRQQSSPLC